MPVFMGVVAAIFSWPLSFDWGGATLFWIHVGTIEPLVHIVEKKMPFVSVIYSTFHREQER